MFSTYYRTGGIRIASSGTVCSLEGKNIQVIVTLTDENGRKSDCFVEFDFIDDGNMDVSHEIVDIAPAEGIFHTSQKHVIKCRGFDSLVGWGNPRPINLNRLGKSELLLNFTARQHPEQREKILSYTIYACK